VVAAPGESVYLVTGSDRPKVDRTLERLRAHFDPGAIERLTAAGPDGASGEDVVAACNAGSLLGDNRLVLVVDVDGRPDDRGRVSGGWKKADVDAVVEYLSAPAPGAVLCLVAHALKRDSPLAKACAKAGSVLDWEVSRKDLDKWVGEQFAARGVKVERDACRALLQIVGDDKLALALEVDKLATWAAGEPVGSDEVRQLAVAFGDRPPWDLTDAWGDHDVATALDVVEEELDRNAIPRRAQAALLVGSLTAHLSRLRQLTALAREGIRAKDAAGRLKLHPFQAEKLARQAEGFSPEELDDATVRLARLDHALKGGSRLAPDLELQLAVADLARERR
jgi:DNA polymerase III subunit delta